MSHKYWRRDNPYRTQALEWVGILHSDGDQSARAALAKRGISERTLRSWVSGHVWRITRKRVEKLERVLLDHELVPWSEHYFSMSDSMWRVAQQGGVQAVTHSLAEERKRCPSSAVERDLGVVRANPNRAQDVCPSTYRRGSAPAVAREFGHYASLMEERFSRGDFPKDPSEAKPSEWTTVLLLSQYLRDASPVAGAHPDLIESLRDWITAGCGKGSASRKAWQRILLYKIAEQRLIDAWRPNMSLEARKGLLDGLDWFECVQRYADVVRGNVTVARNALASASAVKDRGRYRHWHRVLCDLDADWKRPLKLKEKGYLDKDFNDFLEWWRVSGDEPFEQTLAWQGKCTWISVKRSRSVGG